MKSEPTALRPLRYVMALGITAGVVLGGFALGRMLEAPIPVAVFAVAAIVSSWYGGLGPGLMATALSTLIGAFFFVEPVGTLKVQNTEDWLRLGALLLTGTVVSWLNEALHGARREALAEARNAEQRRGDLETQVRARELIETERERLLAELETERSRLRALIECVPVGVAMAEAPSGKVVLWNPKIEELFRHPILPTPGIDTYDQWGARHPDGRPYESREYPLARALQGEVIHSEDLLYKKGDGTTGWIRVSAAPVLEKDQITGAVVLFFDVDQEKQAQVELRDSQERLNIALSAARMGSWHLDLATNELTTSASFRANFGRGPDEPLTYDMAFEAMYPEDRPRIRELVAAAVRERKQYRSEYRIFWRDGSLHWITSVGRISIGDDGRPVSMDGVTLDITEQRQLEESLRQQTAALQEADRRKDEFLAMLAHELRNPLAPIRNTLQILALRKGDPDAVDRARELMERQVQQMIRLVDDLLDVSRITRGKITLRREPVDLAEVVATAVETSRPLIEARRHDLKVSLPGHPLRVEGDAPRLAQVLSNLLNNAAKYTEVGGRIELSAAREDGQAVLRVRDTGIGIAPEMLPRVFDLFAQVESATDRAQGGLGVGLTLVRQLVEMHGGTVEAHSAGLSRGSELTVRLPALAEPEQSEAAPADREAEEAGNGRPARRILIVDDNVDSAESLALLLGLYGHDVRLAHDGLTGLEQARALSPDVMLLDIGLPRLDGYEVARRLRSDSALDSVLLVAMTGYGQEQDRQRSREAGFDHHLVKPLDLERLQALLGQLQ